MYSEWHFFCRMDFDTTLIFLTWLEKGFSFFNLLFHMPMHYCGPIKSSFIFSSQGKNYGHETLDFSQTTIWPNKAGQNPWKKSEANDDWNIVLIYIF